MIATDVAACLDTRPVGQSDVHHDQVRLEPIGCGDRLRDGPGLGHDMEVLTAVERRHDALADHLVVVDHQHTQRGRSRRG
jgi:hypothetical protein